MSLRTRLAGLLAVAVVVAVVISGVGAYLSARGAFTDEVDDFLAARAERLASAPTLAEGFNARPVRGVIRPGVGDVVLLEFDATVQILDRQGTVRFSVDGQQALPVDATDRRIAGSGEGERYRTVNIAGADYRILTAGLPEVGAVQVARPLDEIDEALGSLTRRTVVFGVIAAVGIAALGWIASRRVTRPVERLTAAAEHVASTQDLATPIGVTGDDEVGRLGRSFDTMLTALDTSRRQQRRLVQDASHELRTPLTSLTTNVEILQRRLEVLDADQRDAILADMRVELGELADLTSELVDLATDPDRADEPLSDVSLGELAESVAERSRRRTGRAVTVSGDRDGRVQARGAAVERALSNLVANAIKFSDDTTAVEIVVGEDHVEVLDRGPGIDDADLPHVFDRFYRATAARDTAGSGLGLAIVRQIVESHGGEVWARHREGGGSAVGFRLPRARGADGSDGHGAAPGSGPASTGSPGSAPHADQEPT